MGEIYQISHKPMSTQFATDLKLARKKAGLTLKDVAHLIDQHPGTVSALERGDRPPSVAQTCSLALIFGRTFQGLFNEEIHNAKPAVLKRLSSLPEPSRFWPGRKVRSRSLSRLHDRLVTSD